MQSLRESKENQFFTALNEITDVFKPEEIIELFNSEIADELVKFFEPKLEKSTRINQFLDRFEKERIFKKINHFFKKCKDESDLLMDLATQIQQFKDKILNNLKTDLIKKINVDYLRLLKESLTDESFQTVMKVNVDDYLANFYKSELIKLWKKYLYQLEMECCNFNAPRYKQFLNIYLEIIENEVKVIDPTLGWTLHIIRSKKIPNESSIKENDNEVLKKIIQSVKADKTATLKINCDMLDGFYLLRLESIILKKNTDESKAQTTTVPSKIKYHSI